MPALFLLVLIAPFTCVVVLAWFGNSKPLAAWVLLGALSAVVFLLGTRRTALRDTTRDASQTV